MPAEAVPELTRPFDPKTAFIGSVSAAGRSLGDFQGHCACGSHVSRP